MTKYKAAAQIANQTLQGVIAQCVAGKKVVDICEFGDTVIVAQCAASFKSKKVEKGVAFPTCLSVNEVVCHYSPLAAESTTLAEGDIVKIDLGCHVDGYIAVVAHTLVVPKAEAAPTDAPEPLPSKANDVIVAAYTAAEAALRLLRPGNKNTEVTAMIKSIADTFGVTAVHGTMSHQMKQFVIDGNKTILQREEPDQKVEEVTFEANEVYAIDICFSSGEGKPRDTDFRTTVFRRAVEKTYSLKVKASRHLLNEVGRRFPTLPFTIRSLADEREARMGLPECTRHGLLHLYPVLAEKAGNFVAHFKFTVLMLPSGPSKVTGLPLPPQFVSDKTALLSEETVALLKASATTKKKNRSARRAKAGAGGATAAAGDDEADE